MRVYQYHCRNESFQFLRVNLWNHFFRKLDLYRCDESELDCDEYGYNDEGYKCDGSDRDYDFETDTKSDGTSGICRKTKIHCSGSILNEDTIVTAAHCFVDEDGNRISSEEINEMTVIVGANEPTNEEYLTKQRRSIQQVKIRPRRVKLHPNYNVNTKSAYYDVAIVKIKGRLR